MCQFPLDQLTPCGIDLADFNYLMALTGVLCGFVLWKAIYDAFLN